MSKLAVLLGKTEAQVNRLIGELEHKSGYESCDARFLADQHQAVRKRISALGLDADDTTAKELYHSLLAKFNHDSQLFDKSVGVHEHSSTAQKIRVSERFLSLVLSHADVWALKSSVLKNLLSEHCPSKTVKALGYRSVESMLKRENLAAVMLAVNKCQSVSWLNKFNRALTRMSASKYEMRPVRLVRAVLDPKVLASSEPVSGSLVLNDEPRTPKINSLSLCLVACSEVAKISARPAETNLVHSILSLRWWQDNAHLVSIIEGLPVSLNLSDVAHNYIYALQVEKNSIKHAAAQIESKLLDIYGAKSEAEPIESTNDNLVRQIATEVVEV